MIKKPERAPPLRIKRGKKRYIRVKNIVFFILLFLSGYLLHAQQTDFTGLWKGTMYNDTNGLFYKYEIGISYEKNKYSGFSHTYFLQDDKEYFGVKKLNIHINNLGKVIIRDDGLIANNYPEAPAKGVKQTNILTLERKDSIMILEGPYSTNQTKTYHAVTGYVKLERKNDYWKSALIPHLQELGEVQSLSFVKPDSKTNPDQNIDADKVIHIYKPLPRKPVSAVLPVAVGTQVETRNELKSVVRDTSSSQLSTFEKNAIPEEDKILQKDFRNIAALNTTAVHPVTISSVNRIPINEPPAAHAFERVTILEQTVEFSRDSLQLSLYDNGEVDGDTVSVLMDGEVLLARQGLSTTAIRKTIYIEPERDEVVLVLYAENLGKIPPNTGLLVIHDGKSIYEVRFSGDYQKNSAIRFRRKR